jgi:large conductance mechanosensitive channel
MGGFKQFLLRGNVVDMAVGVVMGVAFNNVITALVKDLITPLIAAIGGNPDFSALMFHLNGSKFMIGDFINVLIAFIILAAVVYYLIVLPVNTLVARSTTAAAPSTKLCPQCTRDIPIKAVRCPYCTSTLT